MSRHVPAPLSTNAQYYIVTPEEGYFPLNGARIVRLPMDVHHDQLVELIEDLVDDDLDDDDSKLITVLKTFGPTYEEPVTTEELRELEEFLKTELQ